MPKLVDLGDKFTHHALIDLLWTSIIAGIGPKEQLVAHSIPIRVESPNVGRGMQDQLSSLSIPMRTWILCQFLFALYIQILQYILRAYLSNSYYRDSDSYRGTPRPPDRSIPEFYSSSTRTTDQ
ncbi:hypothetical protein Pst134EB_010297 [Puccinia striiformis f. sp. tritici]|nr:hypothetical protein Pst134EB_010297 [Puccinia striiformis f. sp. tritici]